MTAPRIHIFFGTDLPLLYERSQSVTSQIIKNNSQIEIKSFEDVSKKELVRFIEDNNLFSYTYLIKVKKIRDSLPLEELEKTPHFLVLSSQEEKDPLPKESDSSVVKKHPCMLPKPWEFPRLIQNKVGRDTPQLLIEYLSSCLQSTLELDDIKKQMDFLNIKTLQMETLERVFKGGEGVQIFTLVDQFFSSSPSLFLGGLEDLLQSGESLDFLYVSLLKKTKELLDIKGLLESKKPSQEIAKVLKLPVFIIEKYVLLLKKYEASSLASLIVKIAQAQFYSRFYSGVFNKVIATRLFLEKKEC